MEIERVEPALTLEAAQILRFPPFPTVPDGVELISFLSFVPSGIRIPIDDDDEDQATGEIERDGLGIPTIPLRAKHATDGAEKKKKKKKKKVGGSQQVQVAPEKPKTWWESWEELEDIRRNSYDSNMAAADRLYQAGVDFKNGRTWPAASLGVQHVWDIFRLYIGLLQQSPAPKEATQDGAVESDNADSDSDDGNDAPTDDRIEDQAEDNRLEIFLNDPELSMRLFFSSHFRERGLIWSEPRCVATPILASFFLRYIVRSRVYPEPEYERLMKRALEIVELARVELPNSWKMGRALPDAFSDGCKGLWGSMQPMPIWTLPIDSLSGIIEEPAVKRPKLDDTESPEPENCLDDLAVEENPFVDIAAELNSVPVGEWRAAETGQDTAMEGWGPAEDSWDNNPTLPADEDKDKDTAHEPPPQIWDASTVEAPATWDLEPPTLLPLMGPTALPQTHTTGVVEQSTRRIVRVDPPRLPRPLAQNAPPAEAVEEDLACRFARLILAPWDRLDQRTYEAGSDVLPPSVLSTSRGQAVMDEGEEDEPTPGAHRPWKDEITVLVDPNLTDVFIKGMGLGATWVEIVRDKEAEGTGSSAAPKKGKGKKKEVPKYWYMEQLVHQIPSFYIDKTEGD